MFGGSDDLGQLFGNSAYNLFIPIVLFIILTRNFTVVSFVIRTKDKWDTYALAKAIVIIKPIAHLNVN